MSEVDEIEKYWEKKLDLDHRRNIYMFFTMLFTMLTAVGAIILIFL